MFGDRDDIGARDLGDGDSAVGLVGGVEVDVVGADAGGDGELEVLGLFEALGGEIAGVEAWGVLVGSGGGVGGDLRCGDDDLGVNELLVESRVLALFVRGADEGVALRLEPFAEPKLVFGGSQERRDLIGMDAALDAVSDWSVGYVGEGELTS